MSAENLRPLFAVGEPERSCRLRELRIAACLLLGRGHPLTLAAAAAASGQADVDALLTEIGGLPPLPRRRLLATLAAVLP